MMDFSSPAGMAQLIAKAEVAGYGHLIELLRSAMRGEGNLCVPSRDTAMPPLWRLGKKRPLICLVGDDDYLEGGPSTWACAEKLRSWAAFAIIHGSGAECWQYAMAASVAREAKRLLFVETSSAAAQDWAEFLRQRADLKFWGILPKTGPHPVMPARGDVN